MSGLDLTLGVVQTAYANGASTDYLRKELVGLERDFMASSSNYPIFQGITAECTPTGVKHLHKRAKTFDIAVYFEANGHGTVLFSPTSVETIKTALTCPNNSEKCATALQDLLNLSRLINQTIGDAISDLLAVEAILQRLNWGVADWEGMYSDYANRLMKVKVADRKVVTTRDAERFCVTPEGLQNEIDKLVAEVENGRSFVRWGRKRNGNRLSLYSPQTLRHRRRCSRLRRSCRPRIRR